MSESTTQQQQIDARIARLTKEFLTQYPALPLVFPRVMSEEMTRTLAPFNIIHDLPGKPIELFSAAIDRTGVQPQDSLINDCIAAYTEQGNPVMIGAGDYLCDSSIVMLDYSQVKASRKATFVKNFPTFALLSQTAFGVPIREIIWHGGIFRHLDPEVNSSNPITLNIIESDIGFIQIMKWGGQGRLLFFGDHNLIHDINAVNEDENGVGQGGGFWVGRALENLVSNCYCKTGDDAFMWNLSAQGSFTGGLCAGNVYYGCVGHSTNARVLVSAMNRTGVGNDIDGEIRDNVAVAVVGKGMMGFACYNTLGTGPIKNLRLSKCSFDCSLYETTNAAIDIYGDETHGGVDNIELDSVDVKSPADRALRIRGISSNIQVKGGSYDAPRNAGRNTVDVDEAAEAYFTNYVVLRGSETSDDIVQVGQDGTSRARAYFNGVRFEEIPDGHEAILFTSSAAGVVDDTRFLQRDGATTARAFNVAADALGVRVGVNDYSDLAIATKVIWNAADNSGAKWQDDNVVLMSTNVTTRTHNSGTTYILTGAVNRTLTLMAAAGGLTVGGVQDDAGALRIQALAGDIIKVGTLASTDGGYIESASVGATVKLAGRDGVWRAVEVYGTWVAA